MTFGSPSMSAPFKGGEAGMRPARDTHSAAYRVISSFRAIVADRTAQPMASAGRQALIKARPGAEMHWRRGAQLGAADLMLAAHARAMGATVVTNNTKGFGRVKNLQVENW